MRRALFVLGTVAMLIGATATPSRAATTTTITASTNVTTVRVGTTAYVEGTVDPADAIGSVVVQRAVDKRWADRATGRVDPTTGAFRIPITPSETGTYKMRVRSPGGSVWSTTFYLAVTAPPTTITAGLSASTVTVGTTVYVQGKVSPATSLSRVVVQRAVDRKWADRQAGSVNRSTGAYRIAITPGETGTYKLRVRSNGGSVWSSTIYLTVKAAPRPVTPSCDPNYRPCVPIASDVDCAGGSGNGPAYVAGPVTVIGRDIYGLDSDKDGIGCE